MFLTIDMVGVSKNFLKFAILFWYIVPHANSLRSFLFEKGTPATQATCAFVLCRCGVNFLVLPFICCCCYFLFHGSLTIVYS